jgi:hypothetical protein
MLVAAAPRPASPMPKTCSSWLSMPRRAASDAAVDLVAVTCAVRNMLVARVTLSTVTPRPKKPAPVYWPAEVARLTCCREYPGVLALEMLLPVVWSCAYAANIARVPSCISIDMVGSW